MVVVVLVFFVSYEVYFEVYMISLERVFELMRLMLRWGIRNIGSVLNFYFFDLLYIVNLNFIFLFLVDLLFLLMGFYF